MSTATQTLNLAIASPGNRLSRLLWMVSCSLLVSASHARAHQPDPVISPYVQRPPVIDGKLSEWPASDFVSVTPQTGVFDAESDSTGDALRVPAHAGGPDRQRHGKQPRTRGHELHGTAFR